MENDGDPFDAVLQSPELLKLIFEDLGLLGTAAASSVCKAWSEALAAIPEDHPLWRRGVVRDSRPSSRRPAGRVFTAFECNKHSILHRKALPSVDPNRGKPRHANRVLLSTSLAVDVSVYVKVQIHSYVYRNGILRREWALSVVPLQKLFRE